MIKQMEFIRSISPTKYYHEYLTLNILRVFAYDAHFTQFLHLQSNNQYSFCESYMY